MSESPKEEKSSQKSNESNKVHLSENEEKDQINHEEEISEDRFKIQQDQNSNVLLGKLIQLIQECLLAPINKFNKDIFIKYDKDKLADKYSLDLIEVEINNFKMFYIDEQYKIINELITKYDLVQSLKNISEEKIFDEELKKFNINGELLSFFGPFSNKIKELNERGKVNDSLEIEKFLFKLLEINYYQQKTAMIENNIKLLDEQIEDLKNKNKIL